VIEITLEQEKLHISAKDYLGELLTLFEVGGCDTLGCLR
jgi:hypothetical protein